MNEAFGPLLGPISTANTGRDTTHLRKLLDTARRHRLPGRPDAVLLVPVTRPITTERDR